MLRQHLAGDKRAAGIEFPLRDRPLPFLKQIRQNPFVGHRHAFRRIGHDETHGQSVAFTVRLPASTMPPMRKLRPCGTSPFAACVGV